MTTGTPFRGLSAFPLTPADEHGRVDTETLARLVERLCEAGVDAIGLLGSTGIYAYLSREERRRAVEAASECVRGRVPLVVGVGTLRTDHAMDLARDAETAGADALLMAPGLLHAVDAGRGLRALPGGDGRLGPAAMHLQQSWHDALHLRHRPASAAVTSPDDPGCEDAPSGTQ